MKGRKIVCFSSAIIISCFLLIPAAANAQFGSFTKHDLIEFTSEWTGERFNNGRPKVPDEILERMRQVTIEEAWGVLRRNGYEFQFEGNWMNIHPDRVIVGRAVTANFMPKRADVHNTTEERGKIMGCIGGQNSWVIDTLVENDLIVVDVFSKVIDGTYAGDNLANSIAAKSKTGMVIDGGVRDLDWIYRIPDFNAFVRGVDPTGIRDVTLMGINVPIRIGHVTVMPGDVVLGRREGVIFIPPHLGP